MDKLKAKREERAEKELRFAELVEKAEKGALTKDENTELEGLSSELDAIDAEVEKLEAIENRAKKVAEKKLKEKASFIPGAPQDRASEVKEMNALGRKYQFTKAFNLASKGAKLDGVERELFEEAEQEAHEAGVSIQGSIAIPSKFIQIGKTKALNVATEGTDVVETELRGLIPILQPDPKVVQLGITVLSGLRGNVQFPRHSGDVAFAWEGESDANAETTPTYNNISISPNRVGGYVDVTTQMLKQSSFVVESHLRNRLNVRYGLTIDDAVLDGAGSGNEPTGIFNYSGVNVLSLGSGSSNDMTYAALLSMIRDTKVANGREGTSGFITNAYGEHALAITPRQGSGVEGNFIYQYGSGNLVGHKFVTSQVVRSDYSEGGQSDLVGMIFSSNWSSAILGQWGGLDILFDPYTQATSATVRFVCNAFMDVELEQAAEFTYTKDWDATDLPAIT